MMFAKFVFVGVLNTALDLAVLNLLVYLFGVGEHGGYYAVFKGISFTAAALNSFICNKYWVFPSTGRKGMKEPALFAVISGMGFVLNVGVSFLVFTALKSSIPSTHLAVTIGAIVGSCVVLAWNFIGYKMIVFKPPHVSS